MQVSVSRDKHGEQIDAVAAERLAQLRETEPSPEQLAELSDIVMLPGAVRVRRRTNSLVPSGRSFKKP